MRNRCVRLVTFGGLLLLLASCSSHHSAPSGGSDSAQYSRPHRDGAPWWEVDVSKIPDAVPTSPQGPVKASPYTVLGKTYYPVSDASRYRATGTASWYGTKFHGQATANGEAYDLYGMTAAHKTLPLPCYVRVTNLDNKRSVILRVNDRGPFYSDRIIDLSFAAAKKLGYAEVGTARVRVEGIDPDRWLAEHRQSAPLVVAQTTGSESVAPVAIPPGERYSPRPLQDAAAMQAASAVAPASTQGIYLQVGAFANPDAAELLKAKLGSLSRAPVFISPVVRGQQTLHRVRLGPIGSQSEARRLQDSVRLARLGQPTLVSPD